MKRILVILATVILSGTAFGQASQRQRLEKHLYTLASDSLRGRKAGTADAAKAARYITRQWDEMGVKNKKEHAFSEAIANGIFHNYFFVIKGNDPVLKDRYIVIGAHYDHVGVKRGNIYNGADDNASGSACVIEVARQLLAKQGQLKRSIIICAFDAEELGLFGSKDLVKQLEDSGMVDKVDLMMSVDMVGWYKANGSLILEGTGTLEDGKALTDPATLGVDINITTKKFEKSILTATDTEPFAKAGIPTLAVTTGLKSPYHKPEDDANLIDYEGLDRVTDYIAALAVAAANRTDNLASGKVAIKHRSTQPAFNFGLLLGWNSSNITFPKAAFDGKYGTGFTTGLLLQYNFKKYWGIRADVLYAYTHSPYPDMSSPYDKSYGIEQHNLLVPLMLQLHTKDPSNCVYFNFGGYYGRVLGGGFYDRTSTSVGPDYNSEDNHWGMACEFGFRLGYRFQFDFTYLTQLNDLFKTGDGLPYACKWASCFTLGYIF